MKSLWLKYTKRILKVILYTTLSVLLLLLIGTLIFYLPAVQNKVANIAVQKIESKTGQSISIENVAISWYGSAKVKGLFAKDSKGDTLINAGLIKININFWELLDKTIQLDKVVLENATIHIAKQSDSVMNFNPYLKAFSKDKNKPDSSKNKFSITLKQIKTDHVYFTYTNEPEQNKVKVKLGDLNIKLNETDFSHKVIDVKNISIEKSRIYIVTNAKNPNDESKPFPFHLKLQKKISLEDVSFILQDNFSAQRLAFNHINLNLTADKLNLREKHIELDKISLFDSDIKIEKEKITVKDSQRIAEFEKSKIEQDFSWFISANQVELDNNRFSLVDQNKLKTGRGIDYADLQLNNIIGNFKNINLHRNYLAVGLDELSFNEKTGFKLQNLTADFKFNSKQTTISNFILKTPYTKIEQSLKLEYNSVSQLKEDPAKTNITLNLDSARLGISDLSYFIPPGLDTNSVVSGLTHNLLLSAKIKSNRDTLNINTLKAKYDSTSISLKGFLTNYKKLSDSSYASIKVDKFLTTKRNVSTILPDSILPHKIKLPPKVEMALNFKGNKYLLKTNAEINSSYGKITAYAKIDQSEQKDQREFSGNIKMADFMLGKLISNDSIGAITQDINAEGFLPEKSYQNLSAQISIKVKRANLLGYDYKNFSLDGDIANNKVNANVNYADSNLVFSFTGNINNEDSIPEFDFGLNLKGADFSALHISPRDLKMKGKLQAHFAGNNLNNGNGNILLSDMAFVSKEKHVELDSLKAVLNNKVKNTEFTIESEPFQADYSGTIKLGILAGNLKTHFSQYIPWRSDSIISQDTTGHFNFKMKLSNAELLTKILFPDLKSMLPINIVSSYNAVHNAFNLKADVPDLQYNNFHIEALKMNLNTSDSTHLKYSVSFDQIAAKSFGLSRTVLTGKAIADTLTGNLRMPNETGKLKFLAKASITNKDNLMQLHFDADSIILNYKSFNLPDNNLIVFDSTDTKFNNVVLKSQNQKLIVRNDTSDKKDYVMNFSEFAMSNIIGILEGENEIVDGILNGDVILQNGTRGSLFNADILLQNVLIHNDTVFNKVSLKANNMDKNRIEIISDLTGDEDKIKLQGFMSSQGDQTALDFDLNVNQLNLSYFEPFVGKSLEEMEGLIKGNLKISGTSQTPDFTGHLELENIAVKPAYLNTVLKVNNEKLAVKDNKVVFDHFTFTDNENNKTEIDGKIDLQNFTRPEFNLSLHSNHFRFLNTTYQEGRLYYGKVRANIDATLKGTPAQPNVNITAYLGEGSDFHFVIPELNSASVEEEGIVRFVNKKDSIWSNITKKPNEVKDSLTEFRGLGLNLSANLEIDSKMNIFIEVDPASNEELFVKGNANLSFIKRSGETPSLNGRFEIEDGTYTLTLYEIIRRTFYIQQGSYLMWNGDIQNPITDITTTYKVHTSPVPLISSETTNLSSESTNKYSNNTTFLINLNIKGKLLKPSLNFELNTLPGESDALVQAKLAQLNQNESQLHKQVFSLLLFNSFIENTASSNRSTAYELNATARTSVSKLLTRQISSFTDKYIKYVDLDVGVNSYYNALGDRSSGKTEVSLDLSKRLFNDQLTVKLGGDFNVENTEQNKKQNLSTVAGDVVIEYKIDEDGTYRIQGFNKKEYEDFFDGEVNKTGAAFIFNKDFYRIKNLFNSDTTRKSKRKDK